jgi:Domain of unknown function (DUF4258)
LSSTDGCRDPERCAQIAERHRQLMARVLPYASEEHAAFLSYPWHSIVATRHATMRILKRTYSFEDVRDVIECTEPIEFGETSPIDIIQGPDREEGIYLVYNVLFSGESQDRRPVHVVCRYGPRPAEGKRWLMKIITVYDPTARAYQWQNNFTERICFCGPDEEGQDDDWN